MSFKGASEHEINFFYTSVGTLEWADAVGDRAHDTIGQWQK